MEKPEGMVGQFIFSISEFAEMNGITTETLRYYDRIGLLKPIVKKKSGWRYYTIRQYEKIRTIIELRKAGMSIKEVQAYFDNRNIQKSIRMIEKLQKDLQRRIDEEIQMNRELLEKIKFLHSLEDLTPCGTIFEKDFPARYMVTLDVTSVNREEHAMEYTKLTSILKTRIPILASDRVGIYSDEKILYPSAGFVKAYPMLLVDPGDADSEYVIQIPPGRYVCMYYSDGLLQKYHPSFDKVREYLEEHHLTISGHILQTYKVDVTLTNESEEVVIELQVPVKKNRQPEVTLPRLPGRYPLQA